MNQKVSIWMIKNKHLFPKSGRVLELGSRDVNGEVKSLFPGYEYVGLDMIDGKNVDIVGNANDIPKLFEKETFDIVIANCIFEHDKYWWKSLDGVNWVLKEGGCFMCVVPCFGFSLHSYPSDYYRFSEEAVRQVIFEGFDILALDTINTKERDGLGINYIILVIGRK